MKKYIKSKLKFSNFKYSPSTKLDGPPAPKLNPLSYVIDQSEEDTEQSPPPCLKPI
jgi:hypothetical protein